MEKEEGGGVNLGGRGKRSESPMSAPRNFPWGHQTSAAILLLHRPAQGCGSVQHSEADAHGRCGRTVTDIYH